MSYILDALKKSEQARTGADTRKMFEELPQFPAEHPRPSRSARRWLYPIAFILVLTVSFFVFRVGTRRSSAPPPRKHLAAYKPAAAGIGHPGLQSHHPAAQGKAGATAGHPGSGALAVRPSHRLARTAVTESTPPARWNARHVESRIARKSHAKDLSAKRELGKPQPFGPHKASRRVEAAAKKAPLSAPSNSHESRQAAVALKAAHLKALLEKQAEQVEKTAKSGPNRERLADIRGFSAPDSSKGPRVQRFSQLPPRIREALPAISVSMLVYSKQPADRFIYINGSKRHEGDEISPGLTVQRITPDGAIFAYRGLHFYKGVIGN